MSYGFALCFQVEHIIVRPEMETAFIRLFPGAIIKGEKVSIARYFFKPSLLIINIW